MLTRHHWAYLQDEVTSQGVDSSKMSLTITCSRPRWCRWHSPGDKNHSQIDYIMVKKRFRSSVNIDKARKFSPADVGSDHHFDDVSCPPINEEQEI
ncbi:hypothetical protein PoB_000238000 [Plakobranchus ocellatus]|uniref:Uncharacterized protein n=1 Tax=Plakobranchus ocellatus TaxID=259542 RepID=A0AAV3XYH5_9GAST|nr:hypothetical protein PoB_000238000 [Plakobranchus ocellatus]